MTDLVTSERHGDILLLRVSHPPVNALSVPVRRALIAALAAVEADSTLRGAVIAGSGRTFIAGADIREFDQPPPADATTGAICAMLDNGTKPVVAALHGTALGGGFEVALACHARVMAPDARVGLPEVRIGLIPGAGGTQRAPRLAGAMAALDMVATGRHLQADEAVKLGLVDEIATDYLAAAIGRARALANAGRHPRVRDRAVPPVDRAAFDAACAAIRARARGADAPPAAADAIAWALDLPFDAAIAREHQASSTLRASAQCRALRHIFHAERVAARLAPINGQPPTPWPIRRTGVVGGGTMGPGIAISLAEAGLPVTLVDRDATALHAAEVRIHTIWDRRRAAGRITQAGQAERLARMTFTPHLNALADSDLIIEAIVEDLPAKQDVFRRLSALTRRDTILASNTSRLEIDKLADVVDAPERVLGLHFFRPAHVIRLLEIVRAGRTAPEVLATALDLARRIGKTPVIAGICDGFIGDRIFSQWRAQCDFALKDGALPHEVDAALEAYGFAMGPYAAADLAGLDIAWADRKRAAATRDPAARYVPVADWLCERGHFGQKTGAGWYLHRDGKRLPDPEVAALIEQASAARGILRAPIAAATIQARVHAAMVNEACRILAEGIAQRPSDIDVVLVHGYGYPAWRGGPMHEADEIGPPEMLRRVEAMCAASGPGWTTAPLLRDLVTAGRRFGELNR